MAETFLFAKDGEIPLIGFYILFVQDFVQDNILSHDAKVKGKKDGWKIFEIRNK